jgi:outer membrane murein-binding lipoprotein Lpp
MRLITLIIAVVLVSGCATVERWIPSFWDDNQSAKITDIRLSIHNLDCKKDQLSQITEIRNHIEWFRLYSTSKGRLQKDVLKLTHPMYETVEDMYKRNTEGRASATYCELKKKIMAQQAERAAAGILGRW